MRIVYLLYGTLLGLIGFGALPAYGQDALLDTTVRIDSLRITLGEVLVRLELVEGLQLAYREDRMNLGQTITCTTTNPTVGDLLDRISQATRTTYQYVGQQIVFRQEKERYTISGYIRSAQSGEDLIGAAVSDARRSVGTTSNSYGFYSLTLPADSVRLQGTYVGYATLDLPVWLTRDTVINLALPDSEMMAEVVVTAARSPQRLVPEPTYGLPISSTQLQAVPTLLGEADVLKNLQHLPGVQTGKDGGASLYVRGGSPDQNQILLDGVPVYNASHLFGFFSVFNADAVNTTRFIKSAIPARYGGRLSSVVDISLKEGNRHGFHGAGSVGLLASHLMLEGPLGSERTSFLVSARRSYMDVLSRPLEQIVTNNAYEWLSYRFYDLTAKVNHTFSQRDQLYVSLYLGQDHLPPEDITLRPLEVIPADNDTLPDEYPSDSNFTEGLRWGNVTTALRWNHVYNDRLFSNLTLTRSRYHFRYQVLEKYAQVTSDGVDREEVDFYRSSGISDWAAQLDVDFLPSPRHHVRAGAGFTYHAFELGAIRSTQVSNDTIRLDKRYENLVDLRLGSQRIRRG